MAGPTLTMARLRRALKRSPRYLAWRAYESVRWRSRRPWARIYPELVTENRVLRMLGARDIDVLWTELAAQPFFGLSGSRSEVARQFAAAYPDERGAIVTAADALLRHEFDLLGSGPVALGAKLPWLTDFKSGREWPLEYCTDIDYNELDRPTDVKVPWELSRCQHFTTLGQAYWLTGDERYAGEFVAETTDWLAANPFSRGVNWACAMDVALRAISWIWGFYFFADSAACRDRSFRSRYLRGLFLHGEFIVKHLEKADLNGNHYLCDGVGLVFLGCFFRRASAATRWRTLGRSIVEGEIFTQTTEDGVDFEMSTAYHRLVLEGFLTAYVLLRQHGEEPRADCWTRMAKMCEFVAAYTKPNGLAPLVGDADDGRIQILGQQRRNDHRYLLSSAALLFDRPDFKSAAARCWDETFWLLGTDSCERFARLANQTTPPQSIGFPAGGFYVLRSQSAHVFIDCGEVGFGRRGGHGHNDILSFELFLNGFNVATDCGAYLYTASREWRNRFRSTAFHNTVQVNREELNRFLAPDSLWQLHYDAVPLEPRLDKRQDVDIFSGGHSGYQRLTSPVTHTRRIVLDRCASRVAVHDRLTGSGTHEVVSRLHLDPQVRAVIDGYDVRLSCGDREVWLLADQQLALSLEDGWVSPGYGVKVPATVVVWSGSVSLPCDLSFMFAERRLSRVERDAAATALEPASASLR